MDNSPFRTSKTLVCAAILLAAGWFAVARIRAQQAAQIYVGILNIVWADARSGQQISAGTPDPQFSLALPDGKILALQLTGQEGVAIANFRKEVTVSGRPLTPAASAATGATAGPYAATVLVDSIAPTNALGAPEALVSGTKKVIFLLVRFSDDSSSPHPPAFYTDMTNPDTPPVGEPFPATINGFFKKTSGNVFSWVGDVGGMGGVGAPGGWLTLPHAKSFYANCGWSGSCAQLSSLANDATALGRAQGIDFKLYDNINFVLNNDLDCCAWGGSYFSSVDSKSYGATWEPPWGQDTSTYSHELGHSIGLPHSGWAYFSYDSGWDTMSDRIGINSIFCASYFSINSGGTSNVYCPEPGNGYIGPHRDFLGWIPSANEVVLAAGTGTTVDLEGSALPFGSAMKLIKICVSGNPCTGSTARYFTVEARVKALGATSQYDNGIPNEGVVIHDVMMNRPAISGPCFFNSQSGWAVPVDSTPGDYNSAGCNSGGRSYPNYGLYNSQFGVGQTYINDTFAFAVSVQSRAGSLFHVVVRAITPPTAVTVAANNITLSGATLNGTVNPNGVNTTAGFDYGTTTAYGSQVAATPAPGSGSSPVAVSAAISGLICGTTYHFRATASSADGSATGSDLSFATSACPSTLTATPSALHYGATKSGAGGAIVFVTPAQDVTVGFSGVTPTWTATANQSWVQITNGSGTGSHAFTVAITNPGNIIGGSTSLSATITIAASGAQPKLVPVTLAVQQSGGSGAVPFGQVDAPAMNASGLQGAIGVSGWALDDIAVTGVKIYRNCLAPDEPSSNCVSGLVPGSPGLPLVFIGDAAFVAGARPDVEAVFPTSPLNYRGGWGYLMLTNGLPHTSNPFAMNGGDGPLTLYAIATDLEGNRTLLGRAANSDHSPTPVTLANDTIAKPFGTIDTPTQGGAASGIMANFGWVITPDTNTIADGTDILMPINGSTLVVYVDGSPIGNVSYNQCRGNVGNPTPAGVYCNDDVASAFGNPTPQPPLTSRSSNPTKFRNLDAGRGPQGSFAVDTTLLANGQHTIGWSATDSNGRADGIGSRFFTTSNGGGAARPQQSVSIQALSKLPVRRFTTRPIAMRVGYDQRAIMEEIEPENDGVRHVDMPMLGRMELQLSGPVDAGYLIANGEARTLPVGSSLDRARGVFAWMPPAGYLGTYRLTFVVNQEQVVVDVTVKQR